jgi:DNA-binding transcriptional MerR regulator
MGQLDLFSLGAKSETPEKKDVKKANAPAKDKDEALDIAKEELAHEVTLTQQSFIQAKQEVTALVASDEQKSVNTEAVVFADERIRIKLKQVQKEEKSKKELVQNEVLELSDAPSIENVKVKEVKLLQKRGRKSFKEIDAEVDLIEVPEDEVLFKKQYYAISEVAGWFKVNTSLLRFWETEFDILKPRKNRKGDRMFRPEDVKNLQLIYHLLRDRKYTIDGAKEYIKGNKKKADTQLQLTRSLQKFKSFLLELKANLQ